MRNEIQNFHRVYNNRNLCITYPIKQEEKNTNLNIKQEFKDSAIQWRCKKKVSKLVRTLQNKI